MTVKDEKNRTCGDLNSKYLEYFGKCCVEFNKNLNISRKI